jgi:hypothetical protein
VDVSVSKKEISRTTNTVSWARVGEFVTWPKWHGMNTNMKVHKQRDELSLQLEFAADSSQGPNKLVIMARSDGGFLDQFSSLKTVGFWNFRSLTLDLPSTLT